MAAHSAVKLPKGGKDEMQRQRGVFEILTGIAGEAADWIHSYIGAWLPWWVRCVIAGFWDAVDTATRIFFWPLFFAFPGLGPVVRGVLDAILVFFGVALWGAPGLLQTFEVFMEFIPGVGWMVDLMPMLTIAGFVARRREREESRTETAAEDYTLAAHGGRFPMQLLGGILGAVLWFFLWWFGAMSFWWWLLIIPVGVGLGYGFNWLQWYGVSARFFRVAAILAVAAVLVSGAIAGYYHFFTSAEDYRQEAWQILKEEKDPQLALAEQKDKFGEQVKGVSEAAGRATRSLGKFGGRAAVDVLEKFNPETPILQDLKSLALKALKPELTPVPQATTTPTKETAATQEIAKRLKLGPSQEALYWSDYVLDRAREIRDRQVRLGVEWAFFFGVALVFVGVAAFVQRHEEGIVAAPPPGGRDAGDFLAE